MGQGAAELQYYRQVWDKQRIGTIFDGEGQESEAIARKEMKRKLAEE